MRRAALVALVAVLVGLMAGAGVALYRPTTARTSTDMARPTDAPTRRAARVVSTGPHYRWDDLLGRGRHVEPSRTQERRGKGKRKPKVDVAAAQQVLSDLGYYLGPIDGEAGYGTQSAVMAFQKVHGLGADGVIGRETLKALDNPITPELRGGDANRIEVDLTKQVLYFVQGGNLERILPVSSGSGATYTTSSGGLARSLTPVGTYYIQRHIRGIREADLGILYDPMYFYGGWAIHGSNSVPAYPASHGCVRVTRHDAVWLFDRVPIGMQVLLYGGTHTFPAGSSAPGTDAPAGDTGSESVGDEPDPSEEPGSDPEPEPDPQPKPKPKPKPEPTTSPKPDPEPEPTPSPKPKPSPTPTPSPSPTLPAEQD